jgi:hypothetical protein
MIWVAGFSLMTGSPVVNRVLLRVVQERLRTRLRTRY